jgi:hypothetical protein
MDYGTNPTTPVSHSVSYSDLKTNPHKLQESVPSIEDSTGGLAPYPPDVSPVRTRPFLTFVKE